MLMFGLRRYGFYKEKYSNGVEIPTLMTGDGKSVFTSTKFMDGCASLLISYGKGSGVIGDGKEFSPNESVTDTNTILQIKFECVESVDVLIEILQRVRNNIKVPK